MNRTPESSLDLRPYQRSDLRAMYELDILCFDEVFRFPLRDMKRFAEARNAVVLIAEHIPHRAGPATLAGFVIVHLEQSGTGRRGYVVTLDVAPALRRSGIAGHLIARAETLAAARGAHTVDLHVHTANASAIRFYEACGYRCAGTERGFYGKGGGTLLDAFVYRKTLAPAVAVRESEAPQ